MTTHTEKLMTVRLPANLAELLDKLIRATGRNKSAITIAALWKYIEAEAWQIQEIEQGITEADQGDFAKTDDVDSFFAKYGA